MLDDLLRLLTLQDGATRTVLLGTTLLGLCAGVVGTFAVLRKRALVGDSLAHTALPGICIAFFIVGERSFATLLLGAFVFGLLGVLCIVMVRAFTRVKEDAAIGIVLASFFGLGLALSKIIANRPRGDRAGLDGFIFGKAASMVHADVLVIAAVAAVVLSLVALLFKELKLLCFDRDFAAAQGWPMLGLDLLLMAMLCTCTVAGLPAVGVVLMAALLIIPAVSARFWSNRLGIMVTVAGAIGAFSGLFGTALSAVLPAPGPRGSWPTGPLITICAAACFLFSLLLAPERGLLAAFFRRRAVRRRVELQNLLRRLYEAQEQGTPLSPADPRLHPAILRRARRAGVIDTATTPALTPAGLQQAVATVRAHRLWEHFLITSAGVASDHVDRDADEIEHHLPPELLARLEAELTSLGRLPGPLPDSPHALPSFGARS